MCARSRGRIGSMRRWLFASTLVASGIPDLQTILLSVMVDLNPPARCALLMNFVLPLAQLLAVLSSPTSCLPRLARQMKRHGAGRGSAPDNRVSARHHRRRPDGAISPSF